MVPLKDSISIIVLQSHFVIIFIDSALAAIAEIDPFIKALLELTRGTWSLQFSL